MRDSWEYKVCGIVVTAFAILMRALFIVGVVIP